MLRKSLFAFAVLLWAASLAAQDTPPDNSAPPPPPGARRGGGMPPCLRQAGVSISVFEQLRSITQDARSQVQSACSDTSLSPPQRRQQIEGIHRQAHEKIEGLVTPDQRRIFAACRERRGERPGVEWFERPGGGCGGARPGTPSGSSSPNDNASQDENGSGNPPPSKESAPPAKNDSAPQKDESSPQK